MKTLKRGSNGEAVKLWQARIGAKPDGGFGPVTERQTKNWQLAHGLKPDGKAGPLTQSAAGFVKTKHSNLYVLRIPFTAIIDADVILEDKSNRQTVDEYAKDYPKYEMFLNAGLFDMKTGANTTDVIIDGKLNNGGNYTDKGLAFDGNKIYPAHTKDITGKPGVDFLGGGPSLIWDWVKNIDLKGLVLSFLSPLTQRMAFGVDNEAFYIITTGRTGKCSLYTILSEGLFQKLKSLIGGDGGGSVAMFWFRIIFNAGRPVPTTIALKLKGDW